MGRRVGLLVPSSNTGMEVDFYRHLPPVATVHTGRMYMEATTVKGEEEMLDDHCLPTASDVATAKPDLVVFGCTSAGALRGNTYDAELCRRISDVTGRPTVSVIESVRQKLMSLDVRRVAVFTPYIDDLNVRIKTSVEDDGIEVSSIHGMGISVNFNLALVEPPQILEFVREKLGVKAHVDALFISCTNYQAVATLPSLRAIYDIPIVTSNQAALEAVGRGLDLDLVGMD